MSAYQSNAGLGGHSVASTTRHVGDSVRSIQDVGDEAMGAGLRARAERKGSLSPADEPASPTSVE